MLTLESNELQLFETVETILTAYPTKRIFCFYGEMGSGKTTIIKQFCKKLGVENIPTSPTFSIVNEYWTHCGTPIYHFDFYRINDISEAFDIGITDYLYSGNYCFIEWTEKIDTIIDEEYVCIQIERIDDSTRRFIIDLIA